jgi:uncharacterized membrane protein/mono/diheme cytochrome c family protein
LRVSILDGKGKDMPAFRGKVKEDQAAGLVDHVRAFAPGKGKPGADKQQERPSSSDFQEEVSRLQEQLDQLKKKSHELSKNSAKRENSRPAESSPRSHPSRPDESSPPSAPSKQSPPKANAPSSPELFRQNCVKCHGMDGTGNEARRRQPKVPNFTDTSWQMQRSDGQLLASILDGKGKEMPPWREKISEEQARSLVGHVRDFARPEEGPGQEPQEGPTPAEPPEQAEIPRDFLWKLIKWLGTFHPPIVHFPIALLPAAAVAELLRLATQRPAFDAISRYCVWFGSLTAVAAGALGWFAGGFHLRDHSGVVMTHRWLGTATVVLVALLLVLSERSRLPQRRRTRTWFRGTLFVVAILVLATGFFGGAVVFGLDHHTWP